MKSHFSVVIVAVPVEGKGRKKRRGDPGCG